MQVRCCAQILLPLTGLVAAGGLLVRDCAHPVAMLTRGMLWMIVVVCSISVALMFPCH